MTTTTANAAATVAPVAKIVEIKQGETTIDRERMSREDNVTHVDVWNALTDLEARSAKTSTTFKEIAALAGCSMHLARHHVYGFRAVGLVRVYREEGKREYRIARTRRTLA